MWKWGDRWDLNPQPLEPQSRALPIELRSPRRRLVAGPETTIGVYHTPRSIVDKRSLLVPLSSVRHVHIFHVWPLFSGRESMWLTSRTLD